MQNTQARLDGVFAKVNPVKRKKRVTENDNTVGIVSFDRWRLKVQRICDNYKLVQAYRNQVATKFCIHLFCKPMNKNM